MPVDKTPSTRRRATLAFAVVSTDLEVRAALDALCAALSTRVGPVLYPQLVRSYGELSAKLVAGGLDVAWTPPLVAAELVRSGVARILACTRRSESRLYHSVIFARGDAGLRTLNDLRGRRMAWVDRASASGYVIPRDWMRQSGISLEGYFAHESFHNTHADVVRAVVRRQADAGATFATLEPRARKIVDAGWVPVVASPGEIEVIGITGAVPADAVTASVRVDEETGRSLTEGLLSLNETERGLVEQVFRSSGFEACSPAYLSSLERLTTRGA